MGKSTFGSCKKLLLPRGIYISSELGPWSQNIFYALLTPIISLFPGNKRGVKFPIPTGIRQNVAHMKQLIEAGLYKAVIDKTYPFSEIRAAYQYVGSGQKIGNVVVRIREI